METQAAYHVHELHVNILEWKTWPLRDTYILYTARKEGVKTHKEFAFCELLKKRIQRILILDQIGEHVLVNCNRYHQPAFEERHFRPMCSRRDNIKMNVTEAGWC
jgi:hypothetical protein